MAGLEGHQSSSSVNEPLPHGDAAQWKALRRGEHTQPHGFLGAHPCQDEIVVRAFHPDAVYAKILFEDGCASVMQCIGHGAFFLTLKGRSFPFRYRVRWKFQDGADFEEFSPYQFEPTFGDLDQHLFNEGRHRGLWNVLGARPWVVDDISGVAFGVWAPAAARVSVVGDFCGWNGLVYPMRAMGSSGVFELFIPGIGPGTLYKFEIRTQSGDILVKADPMGQATERPPKTASRVYESRHVWQDGQWMAQRPTRDVLREPLSVYEVHLGSWVRDPKEPERLLSYREVAPRLIAHAQEHGFNAIELMPITEFPFDDSWGYQVSGFFAPTSRFGSPDDFRWFVDRCHESGVSVIMDWVPAHFPKDAFALAQFDGSHLYEHPDWRRGEHPDWGTLIFNYGRNEVRGFLIASALYWLKEFHIDGLRVDAVASMLYLDYSREQGAWETNILGGREHLEAVAFLRELNDAVREHAPGCFTVAEESTSWSGVTANTDCGGLGFTLKWNMGWMHDTLLFMGKDPIHRTHHHDQLTFAMLYEQSEKFLMPLSHDEVVHGKGSIYNRMPGDRWQKLANLRLLYTYQYTRPGKKLNFMGNEFPQENEWNHRHSLDWHLKEHKDCEEFYSFFKRLGKIYLETSPLWRADYEPNGYEWIDASDRDNSVIAYLRRDEDTYCLIVLNFTPVPRNGYRVGCPDVRELNVLLNSDAREFGGSGVGPLRGVVPDAHPYHGRAFSAVMDLPPLGAILLGSGTS